MMTTPQTSHLVAEPDGASYWILTRHDMAIIARALHRVYHDDQLHLKPRSLSSLVTAGKLIDRLDRDALEAG